MVYGFIDHHSTQTYAELQLGYCILKNRAQNNDNHRFLSRLPASEAPGGKLLKQAAGYSTSRLFLDDGPMSARAPTIFEARSRTEASCFYYLQKGPDPAIAAFSLFLVK